jgi:hypothetical protein
MPRKAQTPDAAPVETDAPVSEMTVPETVVETVAPQADEGPAETASAYAAPPPRFETFEDFYPFYLEEHSHPDNRRLHIVGTGLALFLLAQMVLFHGIWNGLGLIFWAAVIGYGFAWAGHYFIEKNKPATFTYPAWSLMGDFKMFWEVVTRKRAW